MSEMCRHEVIQTWRTDDAKPVMWACAECRLRFYPVNNVEWKEVNMNIDDQDKEMAAGFGAALAMTEEAVSDGIGEIQQMIRKLREGTMGLPSGLELEAAELLERLTAEQRLSAVFAETRKLAADQVPTNWCDPLLTGPNAVIKDLDCRQIEALLRGIQNRIRALAQTDEQGRPMTGGLKESAAPKEDSQTEVNRKIGELMSAADLIPGLERAAEICANLEEWATIEDCAKAIREEIERLK